MAVYWELNGINQWTDGGWVNTYYNLDYAAKAIGDFDGDGDDDLIWRSTVNGNTVAWEIQFPSILSEPSTELVESHPTIRVE